MSFDDLFVLVLFIVFVGLPLLNRLQQRGRGGAPPGAPPGPGRPGAPPQQAGRPTGQAQPRPTGAGAEAAERADREREGRAGGTQASAERRDSEKQDDPFGELAKRLDEARKRVRDASSGQSQSTQPSARTGQQHQPGRTIATPVQPAQATPSILGSSRARREASGGDRSRSESQRAVPDRSSTRQDPRGRPAQRPRTKFSEDAPALEVARGRKAVIGGSDRRDREIARMRAKDLVQLDPSSFRKGMIWHLVLSDPLAHRNRRKPSPPASR